jgi:hypothetical protein
MNKEEIVKRSGKIIAIILRGGLKIAGVQFFTEPSAPLQVALHHYDSKKETHIHKSDVRNAVKITKFHKFLYMTKGTATVYFMTDKLVTFSKIRLLTGDGIIIMSTFHKVVFTKGSNAIEIKQGPYTPDT